MLLSSALLVLMQVCSIRLMVVAMPTCKMQGNLVKEAHHKLRDLGGDFPEECLQYNSNISYTVSAFFVSTANQPQCHQALWVVHESLRVTGTLFEDEELPVGDGGLAWDERKLEDFQSLQYRLLEEGSCLTGIGSSGVLASYFGNVTSLLQPQDSASCGWMALRRDLLKILKMGLQRFHNCFTWRNGQ